MPVSSSDASAVLAGNVSEENLMALRNRVTDVALFTDFTPMLHCKEGNVIRIPRFHLRMTAAVAQTFPLPS